MIRRPLHKYIAGVIALDLLSAIMAVGALVLLLSVESKQSFLLERGLYDTPLWAILPVICVVFPLFWGAIYSVSGSYNNILRASRLALLGKTFGGTLLGVALLILVFNGLTGQSTWINPIDGPIFMAFFALQFALTATNRTIWATRIMHKFNHRKMGFRTLLIGNHESASNVYNEMESQKKSAGNLFVGYVALNQEASCKRLSHLPNLGLHHNLPEIIRFHEIEEVIIAIRSDEYHQLPLLLSMLSDNGTIIKTTPELQDILLGQVKLSSILGTPLAVVQTASMPWWQHIAKRIIDIALSLVGMVLFAPFFVIVALLVKFTSKGPVLFKQERIGRHGKPFIMHKFRTMYEDAEKDGPQLSKENDPRITHLGRFLRKVRVDEIPQLYNVLIGNMSLVGPRPERQFYIDQIMQIAPQYKLILKIRPGLTGWGQVKQGYTENVDQMVSRLKYDLLYLGNMSLTIDLKIIIHTIWIIIQGRGK